MAGPKGTSPSAGNWGRSFFAGSLGHSLWVCERFAHLPTWGCSFVDFLGCGTLLFLWR